MKRSFPYVLTLVLPVIAALAVFGRGAFLLVPPLFLFVVTPALDALLGTHTADLDGDAAAWRDARYDVWLWLWLPAQLVIQTAALFFGARSASPLEVAGLVFASGLLGGIGINAAHELMHRKGAPERAAAELLLYTVCYPQFAVEHVLGHHKNVATPGDPASAQKGANVWWFVPRSVLLSLVSAWRLEGARVAKWRAGAGGAPAGLRDRRLRYPLVLGALVAAVAVAFGPLGVVVFAGQSLVAVGLLETINYVEHYGLARAAVDGGYERVRPAHSWSSAHRLTSYYLLNLPRHADHHENASRPYFALRHVADGPQMPAGYATMILLAAVPPLWRTVMDPRVDGWALQSPSP